MRYFRIEADRKYTTLPQIINWYQQIDNRDLNKEGYDKIPKRTLLFIQPNKNTIFLDVVSSPFFLISEMVKDCVALYEPNLSYKEMILLDQKNSRTQSYFHPMLRELDCLSNNAVFNLDHSELKTIELDEEKIEDKAIFRLAGVSKWYVIVRLDLLESLLRRGAVGLSIQEVNVRKGNAICQNREKKRNI